MPKKQSEFNQLKKLDSRRKSVLLVLMIALFGIGFLVGVLFSYNKARIEKIPFIPEQFFPPTETPRPSTTLLLSPSYKILKRGEIIPLSVVIKGERVQATDIVLKFDPKYFTVSDIVVGDAFPILLRQKVDSGQIMVSTSLDPEKEVSPTLSLGEVFSFNLTAISSTDSAIIEFDPRSTITAKDGKDTLGLTVGGRYIIN